MIARSLRGAEGTYERSYPTGEEFAHAIGYSYVNFGSAGLERFRNSELDGRAGTNLQTILNQLQGKKPKGDKVITTLNPAAQQVANGALAGQRGAVVALDPRTGAVTVMASTPGYDPNALRSQAGAGGVPGHGGEQPGVTGQGGDPRGHRDLAAAERGEGIGEGVEDRRWIEEAGDLGAAEHEDAHRLPARAAAAGAP